MLATRDLKATSMPAGSFVIRSFFLFFFALKRVKEGGFRLGDPLPSFRNLSAIFTAIIQSLHPTSRHAELLTGWGNGLPALAGVLEAIFVPTWVLTSCHFSSSADNYRTRKTRVTGPLTGWRCPAASLVNLLSLLATSRGCPLLTGWGQRRSRRRAIFSLQREISLSPEGCRFVPPG